PVRGALVVQNVNTGAILAMVSIPTYDPNWLIGGITEDRWQQLQRQPGAMVNWAIKGFAPGSTYKMATALAGLEAGVLGPYEQIPCPATYWKYGNPKNWNGDQGVTDVARALAISCNPFFFEVGDRLGLDRLAASNEHLGFGRQTGIDRPGESPGANPSQATYGDDFLPGYTINAAIGQGDVLATPLQLVGYVATIANSGVRYKPYLVQEVRDADGNVLMHRDPVIVEKVPASAQSWQRIQDGMRLTVTSWEGTAHLPLTGFPMPVAAKTGSAETSTGYPHALSVVYAPYENPEIAIAAIIEGGSTGSWVTPVLRRVMDQYFGIHDVIPAEVPTYKD
ncbi:MAG: penicillin-binding transpeptidase domain-containing protein, partial [Mycobacterium leprae]